MEENIALVFHGFLNLNNREKLRMVEEINNYFDSTTREPIRAENETKFQNIVLGSKPTICKCCRQTIKKEV